MSNSKENSRWGRYNKKVFDYLRMYDGRIVSVYIGSIREDLIDFNLDELWLYMVAQDYKYEKSTWIVEGGNA